MNTMNRVWNILMVASKTFVGMAGSLLVYFATINLTALETYIPPFVSSVALLLGTGMLIFFFFLMKTGRRVKTTFDIDSSKHS